MQREQERTRAERDILVLLAAPERAAPFVARVHAAWHDARDLALVLDYCPGGDMATQVCMQCGSISHTTYCPSGWGAAWPSSTNKGVWGGMQLAVHVRLSVEAVTFYAAEMVLALEGLHKAGILYRSVPNAKALYKHTHRHTYICTCTWRY